MKTMMGMVVRSDKRQMSWLRMLFFLFCLQTEEERTRLVRMYGWHGLGEGGLRLAADARSLAAAPPIDD